MREIASGLAVFVLLCASAGLGILIRPRLPEHHRTRETLELTQITIGLLVTFAAVVLGLLTASVKQGYDSAAQDRQRYALQLTTLDQCLRDYGPDAAKIRVDIQSYTAAVIASTWPEEPPPTGVQYPDVTGMPRVGETPILAALYRSYRPRGERARADRCPTHEARCVMLRSIQGCLARPPGCD